MNLSFLNSMFYTWNIHNPFIQECKIRVRMCGRQSRDQPPAVVFFHWVADIRGSMLLDFTVFNQQPCEKEAVRKWYTTSPDISQVVARALVSPPAELAAGNKSPTPPLRCILQIRWKKHKCHSSGGAQICTARTLFKMLVSTVWVFLSCKENDVIYGCFTILIPTADSICSDIF